jgi:peptidyl-prolyl cis-trans isomerase SurA
MISQNTYEEGADALPKHKFEEGYSDVVKQENIILQTKVSDVKPAGEKSLEECKGKSTNDYQQYLEQNWLRIKRLDVKVNNDVFFKSKKSIKEIIPYNDNP